MRARTTWLLFATAVAVLLAVTSAATWALLQLDWRRVQTEQEAVREELVRLSLWRMDSLMTPRLSREIAEAGLPPGRVGLADGVRARFSIGPDGVVEPIGELEPRWRTPLLSLVGGVSLSATVVAVDDATREVASYYRNRKNPPPEPSTVLSPQARNSFEYGKRVASIEDNLAEASAQNPANDEFALQHQGAVDGGPVGILEMMRPLWWGDELVLVRRVQLATGERIEGAWLDWPRLRAELLLEIEDLLPQAQLLPVSPDAEVDDAHRLATLPVALDPGALLLPPDRQRRPLLLAIAAAWVFVLVAVAAVALLLRGSLALSERRAAFVSAVTHELRTPLTTFRMYTEMLEGGMVEDKRNRYLATLRREAERLGQLVENVLSYARIEADRDHRELAPIAVGALVERCHERLAQRCEGAGITLTLELADDVASARLMADVAAVEQVLFNLVDNAAKYGASAEDPRVVLAVTCERETVALRVRDFGPGIAAAERVRVFEPFAKGSAHVAGTKPGVGLGLALCRRLAQQMHGRLELDASEQGACFVLRLPRMPA